MPCTRVIQMDWEHEEAARLQENACGDHSPGRRVLAPGQIQSFGICPNLASGTAAWPRGATVGVVQMQPAKAAAAAASAPCWDNRQGRPDPRYGGSMGASRTRSAVLRTTFMATCGEGLDLLPADRRRCVLSRDPELNVACPRSLQRLDAIELPRRLNA